MTPHETAFFETLRALGQDTLDNLVVVGGWCPWLYARYVWKRQAPEIMTMDVDFAVKHMTPDRFSESVYDKLLAANLVPRKMDMDDDNRVQFAYVSDRMLVPVEFVTSPRVLPRGQPSHSRPYVACDPVPEVDIALKGGSVRRQMDYKGKNYHVDICAPAGFILCKALLLEKRVNTNKRDRDLAGIAFVLRYAPDLESIMGEIRKMMRFAAARKAAAILAKFVSDREKPGYALLTSYFEAWNIPRDQIPDRISQTFAPLLNSIC